MPPGIISISIETSLCPQTLPHRTVTPRTSLITMMAPTLMITFAEDLKVVVRFMNSMTAETCLSIIVWSEAPVLALITFPNIWNHSASWFIKSLTNGPVPPEAPNRILLGRDSRTIAISYFIMTPHIAQRTILFWFFDRILEPFSCLLSIHPFDCLNIPDTPHHIVP